MRGRGCVEEERGEPGIYAKKNLRNCPEWKVQIALSQADSPGSIHEEAPKRRRGGWVDVQQPTLDDPMPCAVTGVWAMKRDSRG